jgi:hypothetical protein
LPVGKDKEILSSPGAGGKTELSAERNLIVKIHPHGDDLIGGILIVGETGGSVSRFQPDEEIVQQTGIETEVKEGKRGGVQDFLILPHGVELTDFNLRGPSVKRFFGFNEVDDLLAMEKVDEEKGN